MSIPDGGGGDDLVVQRSVVIPATELQMTATRSGGPGGQHVNKVSSRITLRWAPGDSAALSEPQRERLLARLASRLTKEGELIVHVDSSRSQSANREEARQRLADVVREALKVPRRRRKTKPTKGSQRRRIEAKKQRGATKRLRGRPPRDD
jgi:ribosome-associated protein